MSVSLLLALGIIASLSAFAVGLLLGYIQSARPRHIEIDKPVTIRSLDKDAHES